MFSIFWLFQAESFITDHSVNRNGFSDNSEYCITAQFVMIERNASERN